MIIYIVTVLIKFIIFATQSFFEKMRKGVVFLPSSINAFDIYLEVDLIPGYISTFHSS